MSQFSSHPSRPNLSDFLNIPGIYPAGRLDADSEGLMLLTDNGMLQYNISHPDHKQPKTYLVQLDGKINTQAIERLQSPINLGNFTTMPCSAAQVQAPEWLWPRDPPIRHRKNTPTSWAAITLLEGKNRQIRRMTAAIGFPTLRLIRISIGSFSLETHPILPGDWIEVSPKQLSNA